MPTTSLIGSNFDLTTLATLSEDLKVLYFVFFFKSVIGRVDEVTSDTRDHVRAQVSH